MDEKDTNIHEFAELSILQEEVRGISGWSPKIDRDDETGFGQLIPNN